jgi:hypothetical protein
MSCPIIKTNLISITWGKLNKLKEIIKFEFGLRIQFYTFWYRNQQIFKNFESQKFLGLKISDFFETSLKIFLNFFCLDPNLKPKRNHLGVTN